MVAREREQAIDEYEVWEANAEMLALWLAVCRYWVREPMGGSVLYLDLAQVRTVMESMGRWPDHEALTLLQAMETEARTVLNEKAHG